MWLLWFIFVKKIRFMVTWLLSLVRRINYATMIHSSWRRHGHNDARAHCQSRCRISLEPKFGVFTVVGTAGVSHGLTLFPESYSRPMWLYVDNVGVNEWNIQTFESMAFVVSSKPFVQLDCQQSQNVFWVTPQSAPHFTHYPENHNPAFYLAYGRGRVYHSKLNTLATFYQ